MYIKKVELKKFKKYKNSTIQLNDELSLLVGGNNSGKSSLLQAMATWQFCKTLLEIEKGRVSWTENATNQGVGLGIVDFTPMFIPSLSHLWTNLKSQKQTEDDGYTLKIKLFWDDILKNEKFLEIGLSLANDRLFIKNTS
ncbi:AAA family ATPase, partial [Escherichia coli]|nr:AAA family ATPase [Escherichia coli]